MTIKQLFLCHPRTAATEVHQLAEALRLRGIVPWVDQQGGFQIGDAQLDTARRVIREECFGLLLYATAAAFDSDFIRRVEMHEALGAHDDDPAFQLVALPRGIDFRDLSRLSLAAYGLDLAGFASRALTAEGAALDSLLAVVARELLDKVLARASGMSNSLQVQFSTRDRLADEAGDVLCVDATRLFGQPWEVTDGARWMRLHRGLRDIKDSVSQRLGRPRLRVHGSKHLTAAFLFGYIFPATAFELDLRVKHGVWSTDCRPAMELPIAVDLRGGSASSTALHLEVSALHQPVAAAVRRYITQVRQSPQVTLRVTVSPAAYHGVMENAAAVAIAHRVRQEVQRVVARYPIEQIHLFVAVPQALATMIGQQLNALPPVQLYEYDGQAYHPSYCLHSDVLSRPLSHHAVGL